MKERNGFERSAMQQHHHHKDFYTVSKLVSKTTEKFVKINERHNIFMNMSDIACLNVNSMKTSLDRGNISALNKKSK